MEQKDSKFKDFVSKHRKALISLVLCVAVAAVFIPTFYKSQVNELNQDIENLTNNEDILDNDDENEVTDVQDEETEDVTDETEDASEELGSAESAVTVAPSENTSQGQSSGSNSGSGHGGSSGAGQTDPGSGSGSGSGSSGSGNSGSGSSDDPGSGNPSTPQEPEQWTCYLEVECHTILNNMENLTEGKEHLVPSNGIIYSSNVKFTPGQSAYDVLRSAMQAAGIQMDAEYNSLYDSAYIRGINNLYEFDCGPYSGWMYSVNGYYPNYGTSVYTLADGDKLVFSYTCDLGRDL